ncbi:hypothetical protein KKF61_01155 [Patescibacteria group bacterium]|nr:hypothetical protein [Patescibacteria group bacterium]MBU0964094.1 hypothetical protein [Patescibacteria group bacterium]
MAKIILIETEGPVRKYLAMVLREMGQEFTEMNDFTIAAQIISRSKCDLVVLFIHQAQSKAGLWLTDIIDKSDNKCSIIVFSDAMSVVRSAKGKYTAAHLLVRFDSGQDAMIKQAITQAL